MKCSVISRFSFEGGLLIVVLLAASVSIVINIRPVSPIEEAVTVLPTIRHVAAVDIPEYVSILPETDNISRVSVKRRGLFTSEQRVQAVGSGYPIPYEATVCPFSGIHQPAMKQLDRDGDGITDDWEQEHKLDRHDASDAAMDIDQDGFSNLEEFKANTNPMLAASHPPYAHKLRFVEQKKSFPYIFQGFTKQSDGTVVVQLNTLMDGKSRFVPVGEELEGVIIKQFIVPLEKRAARLKVMRGSTEIELIRGQETTDPENKIILINLLDRSRIITKMNSFFTLSSDRYKVIDICSEKVVLKDAETGEVYDVIRMVEEE